MAADDFFSRWSKSKPAAGVQAEQATVSANDQQSRAASTEELAPPPTLDDVEKLTHESDFSRFVGRDVDETVKRSALKKLFSDPHFNVMDGLDIYIDDYNKFTPLTPVMLASLEHAKSVLNPPEMQRHDLPSEGEGQVTQGISSPQESDTVAAGESVAPDGGQPADSGEGEAETVAPADEQSLSEDAKDETVSDLDVQDKPLSQGSS